MAGHHRKPDKDRLLRELIAALGRTEHRSPSVLTTLPAALARLLDSDEACAYSIASEQEGVAFDQFQCLGADSDLLRAKANTVLRGVPLDALPYNPLLPPPLQRNVALTLADLVRLDLGVTPASVRDQFRQLVGIAHSDGIRTLVCDGPSLLAFVGAFRRKPFGEAERARLSALTLPLQRRLRLERRYDVCRTAPEVLEVLLEQVLVPALICSEQGTVAAANGVARAGLDAGVLTRASLASAVRNLGATTPFDVVQLGEPGLPRYYLLVARSTAGASARVSELARAWLLTARQREVLEQLVLGASNKAIALALGCSVRTVEVHVTAVFRKAGVTTRAELLARASGMD